MGCFLFLNTYGVVAQGIKIFTLEDFELKNAVKTCLVNTNYGKEEYEFNREGLLTKAITRYNDKDYDIVYYKYKDEELLEKRDETYRDNVFDATTSIAYFYTIDTTENRKVTEKVISYEKELLEQYVYSFDSEDRLVDILRSNAEGTDNTILEYTNIKGQETMTWTMNGEPLKSIRTSEQKKANGTMEKVVLTKEFIKGEGNKAKEEVFAEDGKLLARQDFEYDTDKNTFVPTLRTTFEYNEQGLLLNEISKTNEVIEKISYIYQYDRPENGNWIKKIVTPENTYTTRKITYYEDTTVAEDKKE
jgi:nuclear transport factor 2 (NTF2) superfamily protein